MIAATRLWRGIVGALFCVGCNASGAVVFIEKDGVKVGVLPESAGRVVALHFSGGPNLLDEPVPVMPIWKKPPLDYAWTQDKGQIIWAGPQTVWWRDQNADPVKRDRGDEWPPDPDWTRAVFRVVGQSKSRIVLRSPVSRINGLQLTKTIECLPGGKVRVEARAENRGTRAVSRDLWFVFRAPAAARDYVPVRSSDDVQLSYRWGGGRVRDGLHSLVVSRPWWKAAAANKAQIHPRAPWIACGYPGGFLIFRFPAVPRSETAPSHVAVEIYRKEEKTGASLLEIETHSEMLRIAPGSAISSWQTWEFFPLPPGLSESDRRGILLDRMALPPECGKECYLNRR